MGTLPTSFNTCFTIRSKIHDHNIKRRHDSYYRPRQEIGRTTILNVGITVTIDIRLVGLII